MKYLIAAFIVPILAFSGFALGQGGGESVETQTFTNVVTYTVPTVTETVVSTETVTVTTPTTTEPAPEPDATVLPGDSWDAACDSAAAGDLILVAAGDHTAQTLTCHKAAPGVTFLGEDGAAIAATQTGDDDLSIHGSNLSFEDFDIFDNWYVYEDSSDITFRNINAQKFFIRQAERISIFGGSYISPQASSVPQISSLTNNPTPSSDILLDGVLFERIWRPSGSSAHRECLHVMGVDGLTIKNGVFRECLGNTAALSFNIHYSSIVEGVVVENNLFENTYSGGTYPQPTGTGPSVNISDRAPGYEILFQNNAFRDGNVVVNAGHPVGTGIRWVNNCGVGPAPDPRDWVWENNSWNQPNCGL